MSSARERIVRRAAREVREGMTVNLGIGLPTHIVQYLDAGLSVCLHSENGIAGAGPVVDRDRADRNLIDAGGDYISTIPGTSFFDSAVSFALVRGGRLDLALLGALQVAGNGDLANWIIPGRFAPGVGGGMELAQKARRVVVLTSHCDKQGQPKIVRECTLPLTAPGCVDRVITDLAVLDVGEGGMVLREVAAGVAIDDVVAATGAPLTVDEKTIKEF
ncbi:MAG: 3-oxoacid CoA-transferase subunit B [Woeseiaceae bacterium]|nr:3-oxoacid CoA-transferase subunit B [Woeseiaceae bacterium]